MLNVPSDQVKAKYGYKFNTAGYGDGPWQNTYPPYQWPDTCMGAHTPDLDPC